MLCQIGHTVEDVKIYIEREESSNVNPYFIVNVSTTKIAPRGNLKRATKVLFRLNKALFRLNKALFRLTRATSPAT